MWMYSRESRLFFLTLLASSSFCQKDASLSSVFLETLRLLILNRMAISMKVAKKGNIIYDKDTKDIEIVRFDEDIDTYMKREVLPHIPDAKAFFEEDLSKKKPIVKTGAEIPFTRYFYKYKKPTESSTLKIKFEDLEKSIATRITKIFG